MIQTIDNLADAKLAAGKSYRLAARRHIVTDAVHVPDNCTIDCDGATIVFDQPKKHQLWFVFKKKNVRIFGGEYYLSPNNYAAFLEHGSNYVFQGARLAGGTSHGTHPGGLAIVRGSTNVVIQDCSADVVDKYLVFLEANNDGVVLDRLVLTTGSVNEAGIRIRDSKNVWITNCLITARKLKMKYSALRMQDGENFLVVGGIFTGGFGAGPLADGDGGRNENDSKKRAEKIGKRMKNVRVIGSEIDGEVTLEAGLIDYQQFGGRISSQMMGGGSKKIFGGTTWIYPEKPEWTKSGDPVREQAQGRMIGVSIDGDVSENPIELSDCMINDSRASVARFVKK